MYMYLNGKSGEPITVTSYSRHLNIGDNTNVVFNINFELTGEYPAASFETLAGYGRTPVTAIRVINTDGNKVLADMSNLNAKLIALSESCTDSGKSAYGSFELYGS